MTTQNLMSRSVNRISGFTMQDVVIDLVELSEEDLKQISGGKAIITATGGTTTIRPDGTIINTGGTITIQK